MSHISPVVGPSAGDASAWLPDNRGCCCHGDRIMLTSQGFEVIFCGDQNPWYAHGLTSWRPGRHRQPPAVCCHEVCEPNTHTTHTCTHMVGKILCCACLSACVSVCLCFIAASLKTHNRSIMTWTSLSCKHFTGALTCCVDRHKKKGVLYMRTCLGHFLKREITDVFTFIVHWQITYCKKLMAFTPLKE